MNVAKFLLAVAFGIFAAAAVHSARAAEPNFVASPPLSVPAAPASDG